MGLMENLNSPEQIVDYLRVYSAWAIANTEDMPAVVELPYLLDKAASLIEREIVRANNAKKTMRNVCVGDEVEYGNVKGVVTKKNENGLINVMWAGGVLAKYGIGSYLGFHLTGKTYPQIIDVLNNLRKEVD